MLLLATHALALDLAIRIDQPDLPTHRVVLCGVSEEGATSARVQVPGPGLLAWQLHVFARPGERDTPALVPAFPLAVDGSGAVTYPVLVEGALYPRVVVFGQKEAIVPRLTIVATRLAPGSAGCSA